MHRRRLDAAIRSGAAVALTALALAGCGQDETAPEAQAPSSSNSPSAKSGAPDCAVLWHEGGELPRSYAGCNSEDGFAPMDKLGCSSGQRMVMYGDHFYAVLGGTIHETESPLQDDHGYRVALASCRA